jgi:hypothetical protein
MHARIQTWFPFRVYICINGREWLARQMDHVGLRYIRRKNTFTWLEDVPHAQGLFDQQLQAHWPTLLDGVAETLNPIHAEIFRNFRCRYHWSVQESEWATDVMFRSRASLEAIYPQLIRYAVTTFGAVDVCASCVNESLPAARCLTPAASRYRPISRNASRVCASNIGLINGNSIKLYDKGSVLRAEATLQQPANFKVYRSLEGHPDGAKDWRPMRMGIADLHHRADVSQKANERYLETLAAVHDATPLRQLAEPLCRPAPDLAVASAVHHAGGNSMSQSRSTRPRRARALNPLAADDAALLTHVTRAEFLINGLRNRDLRSLLFRGEPATATEQRKRSAAVTRKLRLLRAHALIEKIPRTHRYIVTDHGRQAITALLAARNACTEQLAA